MMLQLHMWRPLLLIIGGAAGASGAIAAWEYALMLEKGRITYFVLAAPMIACSLVIIPPIATTLWRSGEAIVASGLWLVAIVCASFMFFTGYERVHQAKAGQAAERNARVLAMVRAQSDYEEAKAEITATKTAESKAKANPNCSSSLNCRTLLVQAETARQKLTDSEAALTKTQQAVEEESAIKSPLWLLPLALDLIAFFFIWAGKGPWVTRSSSKINENLTADEAKSFLEFLVDKLRGGPKPGTAVVPAATVK